MNSLSSEKKKKLKKPQNDGPLKFNTEEWNFSSMGSRISKSKKNKIKHIKSNRT